MNTADQLAITADDLAVTTLGPGRYPSPLAALLADRTTSVHYVDEDDLVLLDDTRGLARQRGGDVDSLPAFEPGGPRRSLYFDPAAVVAGIVTCGGLCPGLNDVIRGLVLELAEQYGVEHILGFRNGFRGLIGPEAPMELTPESVSGIDERGGTVLGTSRGNQDPDTMLDTLVAHQVNVLFVIGGDGTLRGAAQLADAALRRGYELAIVGIPKTIDNDIPYIDHSFGFQTAFARAAESIRAAHVEAVSTPHGLGLVKLMGRHSGFVACYAALAHHDVDLVLIPEVRFDLDEVLAHLRALVACKGHAVVVVAEGAGQHLFEDTTAVDASGNAVLADIGVRLKADIGADFARHGADLTLRYVDPGYAIRSVRANGYDVVYCSRLAHAAVHAAMSGRTKMLVGRWHGRFVNIPLALAARGRNVVDPNGDLWLSVLEATGQPFRRLTVA